MTRSQRIGLRSRLAKLLTSLAKRVDPSSDSTVAKVSQINFNSDGEGRDRGTIAREIFQREEYKLAEYLLWEILHDKPESPNATFLLGLAILFQGRVREARPLIDRAYKLRLWIDDRIVASRAIEVLLDAEKQYSDWLWPKYQLARERWRTIGMDLNAAVEYFTEVFERKPSFVQIGANDGKRGDPLNKLIKTYSMSGLLVEPQSAPFELLKTTYANQKNLRFEQAAIVEEDGPVTMFTSSSRTTIGTLDPKRNILRNVDEMQTIVVPGLCFRSLLDKHNIEVFDVLQIDTEGHDFHILKQIDLNNHAIQIVNLELYCMPVAERVGVFQIFEQNGFATIFDGMNLLAIRLNIFSLRFCIVDLLASYDSRN